MRSEVRRAHRDKKTTVLIIVLIILIIIALGLFIGRDRLFKTNYPLEYTDYISEYADKFNINPYLVCAVIYTESGFRSDAVSKVGARGLMQIMPDTGDWIASKLKIDGYTDDMLFDPKINIEFGCWYLSFLDERFGGDKKLMSAAYNAGHNRVAEWLDDSSISENGELTDIPFRETDNYVKKIDAAYEGYIEQYPDAF